MWLEHPTQAGGHGKAPRPARSAPAEDDSQSELYFAPWPDEVARRAYFSYVNQDSPPGHAVQHLLEAEARLLDERNLTRIHGFHNRT
jgi:hypothetical protein